MLLRMEHIEKSFSGIRVLDDVYFDLNPGEVHILAGENGAGKTTLIKILAGVYPDYKGKIYLEDEPVKFKSPNDAAYQGISVIHQEMSLSCTSRSPGSRSSTLRATSYLNGDRVALAMETSGTLKESPWTRRGTSSSRTPTTIGFRSSTPAGIS